VDPTGERLAVVVWDHPDMPWDASTVLVLPLARTGGTGTLQAAGAPWPVAGGPGESVGQPAWRRDGALRFVKRAVHDLPRERAYALREPNYDLFSAREIAIVEEHIRFFWNWPAKDISAYSHGMAWKLADDGDLIPYEAVFISDDPVTEEDVTRVKELAAEHGWKV